MRKAMAGIVAFHLVATLAVGSSQAAAPTGTVELRHGWAIQSAAKVAAGGAAISQPGFSTAGWHAADVPATVLGALVRAGVYQDPFFARNMTGISREPFKGAWWYRTEFSAAAPGAPARLVFDGINYRADVWLNGKKVADKASLHGVWRVFDLDVTTVLREGTNALAVQVFPPAPGDFTVGFVDWNPLPADRNMGLYRGVALRRSGTVSLEDVFVQSHVDLRTLKQAELTISARLVNHGDRAVSGVVTGEIGTKIDTKIGTKIGTVRFRTAYSLAPLENKVLRLSAADVPALRVRNPRLWWPVNLGTPELYTLALVVAAGGQPSDVRNVSFGIREVGDYVNEQGHRGYTVNGKPILIRGGGWVDDLFLRERRCWPGPSRPRWLPAPRASWSSCRSSSRRARFTFWI
jgi:exo-1,4-beta-D-glucosaminidase